MIGTRMLVSIILIISSMIQIVEYKSHGKIYLPKMGNPEGGVAELAYYLVWGLLIIGIVLFAMSLKRSDRRGGRDV